MANADPNRAWDGFYAGVTLNYSRAETTVVGNRFTYNQNRAVNLVEHSYDGRGFGGFVGWNTAIGDLVVGSELSMNRDSLESDLVFNSDNDIDQVEIKWSGALVGRLGLVLGETLIYTKAGLAVARIYNIGGDVNGGTLTLSDAHIRDDIFIGPTYALGTERFIAKNLALRIEFSHTDFGAYSQANEDGAPGSQVYEINNGPVQKLSIGLVYQF